MSDVQVDILTDKEVPESKLIGDKLSGFSAVGNWKSIIVGDKTYEDGWYLIEKEDNIPSYGKAKSNWLINYNKGEIIELEDDSYRIANANTSGALVDDTLKLNIDPSNLQDRSKWKSDETQVSFVGESEGDSNSGVQETEIKFDGVDDYLKIEGVDVNKSDGITFEFYGKINAYSYGGIPILAKVGFDDDNIVKSITDFRMIIDGDILGTCVGKGISGSDLSGSVVNGSDNRHWLYFNEIQCNTEKDSYFSVCINLKTCEVTAYQDGVLKQTTKCDEEYINEAVSLFDNSMPFCVGVMAGGNPIQEMYGNFDLYSCRLYTRVLTDEEIAQNYTATVNYHDGLVKSN